MSEWTKGMKKAARNRLNRPSNLTEYQKRKWSKNWKAWARKSSKKHDKRRMEAIKKFFCL